MEQSQLAQSFRGALNQLDAAVLIEQAEHRSLLVALAAQAYKQKNGKFLKLVTDIDRKTLNQIPIDPFGDVGELIQYRLTPNGFTVWSIGPDQIDDSGTLNHEEISGLRLDPLPKGDIGFRFPRTSKAASH